METEKLAKNNINVQLSLLNDIKSNYSTFLYKITNKSKELKKVFFDVKHNNDETVTIKKDDYNKIYDFINLLSDTETIDKIGSLCKTYYPEIKQKIELLNLLKA